MATTNDLKLGADHGLRLADPERPELGWRTFALDRIRQTQRKKEINPKPSTLSAR